MNLNKTFYVSSFGGSGSKMLCQYLQSFGQVFHIHSRKPPLKLEYIGGNVYFEWFNGNPITDDDYTINKYYVIFIYRNPVKAIYSRFNDPYHLQHIQCDRNIKLTDVIRQNKDLYGIEEFFDNYTNSNSQRNYNIICVKYETLFENFEQLNMILDIPNKPHLYPHKKERNNSDSNSHVLYNIYSHLIKKMDDMPPILFLSQNQNE